MLGMFDNHIQMHEIKHTLMPNTKRNSKWLKVINKRHDTMKLEESIDKTSSDINPTNIILGQSPKAIEIKAKINK